MSIQISLHRELHLYLSSKNMLRAENPRLVRNLSAF